MLRSMSEIMRLMAALFTFLVPLGAAAQTTFPAAELAPGGGVAVKTHDPLTGLSGDDIARYQRIFKFQDAANWKAADREISALGSDLLMGHVRYQRLMHPTGYRSSFSELAAWLRDYHDHPNARRVYRLAKRRQGRAASPVSPSAIPRACRAADWGGDVAVEATSQPRTHPAYTHRARSRSENRRIRLFLRNARHNIRNDRITVTLQTFRGLDQGGRLSDAEAAKLLRQVAHGYFRLKMDEKALPVAQEAARRGRAVMALPDWTAGLIAWRLEKYEDAAEHFDAVATSPHAGEDLASAGGYWAARSHFRAGDARSGYRALRLSAAHDDHFYGMIAGARLGRQYKRDEGARTVRSSLSIARSAIRSPGNEGPGNEAPSKENSGIENPATQTLDMETLAILRTEPQARRYAALHQIGRGTLAVEEFMRLERRCDRALYRALTGLAGYVGDAHAQYRLARARPPGEVVPFDAQYPLSHALAPQSGYKVDKALIFAIVRQESLFNNRAVSRVGARGLMQLMPRTAGFIARDHRLIRARRERLFEPAFNLELGQRYIDHLMENDEANKSLFHLLVGYNAGPGNLRRWLKKLDYNDDPLFMIETLPARETRHYVEVVMRNLWQYRRRLGQPAPSLVEIAKGNWPRYHRLEPQLEQRLALN
ncbi:MAG: lytic transglycosylase domain-containing protein [Pseudomonadota bacterium]